MHLCSMNGCLIMIFLLSDSSPTSLPRAEDTQVVAGVMKSTKVQTLGANIWPGVDAAKELLRVREALRKRMR